MNLTYIVKENDKNLEIKQVLKNELKLSQRLILKLKRNNKIFLNNKSVFINTRIYNKDVIEVNIDFEEESDNIVGTEMTLHILYEDDMYLVLNKPPKIETHPTYANYKNTLANGVKYYFEKNNIKKKIRPVNRLDKDTSGVIIFAKNEYIQQKLIEQMKTNVFKKEYVAILDGILENESGIITAPIRRKENSIIEREVSVDGEEAITEYNVKEYLPENTIVNFFLKTGRTHQIRVHSKYIGHPITGDFLYGKRNEIISRQALHSYKTSFVHPITNKRVIYKADIPKDIVEYIKLKGG